MTAAALLTAGFAAGCAPTHGQFVAFLRAHDTSVSSGRYTVHPPDRLTIHAPQADEIDGASPIVRSDGKIVLRLLGEVNVAGLTTEEIGQKLQEQLSRYYIEPQVVAEVIEYRSKFFYVFGQVRYPGAMRYNGRDSLLKALADAQPNFLAWNSQVRVVRPSPETGEQRVITVDLSKMVRTGQTDQNILLQEGDIVEVPPTPLGWLGLRVRELLYPLEPALRAYNGPASTIDATRDYRDGVDGPDFNN